jgi:hypothetical protein
VDDNRNSPRVDLSGVLRGDVLVPQPALVTQISRTGMQIETSFLLQLDSLHDFRLTLGGHSLVVKGRIAHSRISEVDREAVTYLSGVEFVETSQAVAVVIADYVELILQQRLASSS